MSRLLNAMTNTCRGCMKLHPRPRGRNHVSFGLLYRLVCTKPKALAPGSRKTPVIRGRKSGLTLAHAVPNG